MSGNDVKERMAGQGLFVVASTQEQFAEFLKKEIPRWTKIVKDAGVKPQAIDRVVFVGGPTRMPAVRAFFEGTEES